MLLGEDCEIQVDISQLKAITQNCDHVPESIAYVATRCYWEQSLQSMLQTLGARREYFLKGFGTFGL